MELYGHLGTGEIRSQLRDQSSSHGEDNISSGLGSLLNKMRFMTVFTDNDNSFIECVLFETADIQGIITQKKRNSTSM